MHLFASGLLGAWEGSTCTIHRPKHQEERKKAKYINMAGTWKLIPPGWMHTLQGMAIAYRSQSTASINRFTLFSDPSAQVSAEHLDSDASKGFPHAEINEHSWKHETDQDYAQENQQLGSQ